jgi:O-antigen/teichoic acid export membrane protein
VTAVWERLSTFRRGFASTFVLNVFARGLSAIATVLLVRALSVESFAYVVLFLNVGQFAGSALTGGMRMRYMRVEAERVSRGSGEQTGFALAWGASMALVLGVAALCLVGARLLEPSASGGDPTLFVALATAFTAGHASVELAMYHYQAHLKFVRAGAIDVCRGVAMLLAALFASFGAIDSGPAVAAATALAVLIVAAIPCLPLARATLHARRLAEVAGEFWRESGWLTAYYLASAGFAYATIFLVAALLDDRAVASYGAALRYMSIVFGPFPALMAVMRVRSSQRDVVDSTALQLSMLTRWVRQAGPLVAVVLGLAALLAPVVIPLLDGGRYPDSVPIFQLLLISAFFEYATMPGPNLLLSQRRYKLLAGVYTVALIVQVPAVVFASLAGVVAVAAATAAVRSADWLAIAYLATRVRPRSRPRADFNAGRSDAHQA